MPVWGTIKSKLTRGRNRTYKPWVHIAIPHSFEPQKLCMTQPNPITGIIEKCTTVPYFFFFRHFRCFNLFCGNEPAIECSNADFTPSSSETHSNMSRVPKEKWRPIVELNSREYSQREIDRHWESNNSGIHRWRLSCAPPCRSSRSDPWPIGAVCSW